MQRAIYLADNDEGSLFTRVIVKSVDVLLTIKWAVEAWKLVTIEIIQNCFALCVFSAQSVHQEQEDDDPFNELNYLVRDIDPECSAEEYLRTDQEVPITDEPIDLTNPNWRDNLREKILEQVHTNILSENDTLKSTDLSSDEEVDNFDVVPMEPKIKSYSQALEIVDDLRDFAIVTDKDELVTVISGVATTLEKLKISGRKQKTIMQFFNKTQ